MHANVYEDNSNSLRYWIYTSIITIYLLDCALPLPRAVFLPISSPSSILLYFPSYYPGSLRIFYSFFFSCTPSGLEQLTFPIPLACQSLFYTTTLRSSVEIYPCKTNFYFTWLVRIPNNLHYNLLIHVFNISCTSHDFMHRICWSLGQIERLCRYGSWNWRVQDWHNEVQLRSLHWRTVGFRRQLPRNR